MIDTQENPFLPDPNIRPAPTTPHELILAEHLAPRTARLRNGLHAPRNSELLYSPQLARTAWAELEVAACQSDSRAKQTAWENAWRSFAKLSSEGAEEWVMRAKLALACKPAFERRVFCRTYDQSMYLQLQAGLGALSMELTQHELNVGRGILYEALFLAGCAYAQDPRYLSFPGSIREERGAGGQSARQDDENYNHDGYAIRTGRKVPVQVRGQNNPGNLPTAILPIKMRDIVVWAATGVFGSNALGVRRRGVSGGGERTVSQETAKKLFVQTSRLFEWTGNERPLGEKGEQLLGRIALRIAQQMDVFVENGFARVDQRRS